MMSQWLEIKKTLKDEIVFCRVGDFYELFYSDAEIGSKALDLTLSKRKIGNGTYPLAGVPVRSIDTYVNRLVQQGYRVAIIDQVEDAKAVRGKKTLSRELTRIISKGTITDESMLSPGMNNYLAAICHIQKGRTKEMGLAVCDLSTGDFRAASFLDGEFNDLLRAFTKYSPVEIVYNQEIADISKLYNLSIEVSVVMTPKPSVWFEPKQGTKVVQNQFGVSTLKGYGLDDFSSGAGAAGALLRYISETQFTQFPHIQSIKSFDVNETMILDATAIRGLELFQNNQDQTDYASLFSLLDETVTPMGSRLLHHWLVNPLADDSKINQRLIMVDSLKSDPLLLHNTRAKLSEIGDIERLTTRISMKSAKPDELVKLASSLEIIPSLKHDLMKISESLMEGIMNELDPCIDISQSIRKVIFETPGSTIGGGDVIQSGVNSELDRLRNIKANGDTWLENYVNQQKSETGIDSIRIKQNNVFGYFIEISKKEIEKVPGNYERKQVMINATRYITEELKNWETDIITAEVRILEVETQIYQQLLTDLSKFIQLLQTTALAVAKIDCLVSFAYSAERRDYSRPTINNGKSLIIEKGRHPVIEALNTSTTYIPNDIVLDYDTSRLMVITGPNFSGKSSLLRATALIVIMAQIGSFVPASKAEMGIVDRIFTRIGASDNLVAGQSTFMLEMIDAANLVNNCTERSLIIADELGRGTSTYDGLAIAWSIAEYLHDLPNSPKTMLATHYHQLSELQKVLDTCVNFHFLISFDEDKPVFDHVLKPGSSDKSFGVEVAKLSGLPLGVIDRARKILTLLEDQENKINPDGPNSLNLADLIIQENGQTSLANWFDNPGTSSKPTKKPTKPRIVEHPVLKELKSIDIDKLTPVEALTLLEKLKRMGK